MQDERNEHRDPEPRGHDALFDAMLPEVLPPHPSPPVRKTDGELLAIRERYLPFRALSMQVNHEILVKRVFDYHLDQARKRLQIGSRRTLVFDSEAELPILMDFAIHSVLRGGRNLVDECLTTPQTRFTGEEAEVLQAFRAAHYAVLTVEEPEPGFGLYCLDSSLNPPAHIFLADRTFSQTVEPMTLLATRVVPLDDFFITAGAAIYVHRAAMEPFLLAYLNHRVQKAEERPGGWSEVSRQEDADLANLLVPLLSRLGASFHIAYGEAGKDAPASLLDDDEVDAGDFGEDDGPGLPFRRESPKVGRNDPCPCGSGLKYKKCCGKNA
jgi:hypothetical protein